jgi:ATP-binding cassette subfamily C protein LapB
VSLARYTGSLRFDDCAFAYPKQATPIFERFDFELPAGGVVAVIGANGTGKTTLARLIVALLEPNRGRVLADGMDLRQADPTWWRQQLAYLPQEPVFFDATLRENLTVLDPVATDEDILSLCRELGVAGFVEGGPDGLSLLVRNGGSSIPVGIRRRLALVRALIGRGHLVVLDDPTEGVDAEGCKSIAAVLNRLARSGRSLVVMTNESFIISAAQAVIDLNQKPSPRVLKATPTESKVTDQPL